ncbi:hypothetical protein PHLGIDRAFT_124735 [Phlebiopsis gigantea 11061_1 CR5-6]|uniref:Matrin-type domain-containing protein n=1 Tax=Phlebiopsis gigantea (strain 11061_1 CR5-6) TaxID=745531 RepID=A0A0C3SD85_PHLG1|nr:hypothetical protein PHLGIDRAFT_124735 [Phlebiopsis gigantea 11061_1 CR5-6]
MSEYWVSHKKYFCKYCNIYIADDKPSRTQHETGLKHKGNVERFVRGLYKAGEKRKKDSEEEQREMAHVERAAAAAYAQDVSAGLVKPGSSSTAGPSSKPAGSSKPTTKASDPYTNYSTAQSLGFIDPDEERRKMEAERRRNEGVVGMWEVVDVQEPLSTGDDGAQAIAEPAPELKADADVAQNQQPRKREAEAPLDDEDIRQFKLRRKKVDVGLGELYDPGVIPIKLKAKKEEPTEASLKAEEIPTTISLASTSPPSKATSVPKWSSRGWSKPGEAKRLEAEPAADPLSTKDATTALHSIGETEGLGTEENVGVPDTQISQEVQSIATQEAEVKTEIAASAVNTSGSLFRKRKLPAGGSGRGRR